MSAIEQPKTHSVYGIISFLLSVVALVVLSIESIIYLFSPWGLLLALIVQVIMIVIILGLSRIALKERHNKMMLPGIAMGLAVVNAVIQIFFGFSLIARMF